MNDTAKTPLEYARGRGWTAFPVAVYWNEEKKKHEKKPLTQHGHKDAVPACSLQDCRNFGIPTGTANNLILLDFDLPTSKPELLKMFPSLDMVTVGQTTPSGGEHLLFYSNSTEIQNGTGVFGIEGFDVRGNGGWLASGEGYEITEPDAEIEDLPEDVVKALEEWSAKPAAEKFTFNKVGKIGQGQRDEYLIHRAGQLVHQCNNFDALHMAVQGVNLMNCAPPVSHAQALKCAESAWRMQGKADKPEITGLESFEVTDALLATLKETEWLMPPLVATGYINTIVAPSNGGKSTIAAWMANMFAGMGKTVIYCHPDGNPGDAEMFDRGKLRYLQPQMNNLSMDDLSEVIFSMPGNLNDVIIFIDTIKKATEMIQKDKLRAYMESLRQLTGRGCTIILIAHTNKYKQDGKLVYEGTGDLRTDSDILTYLYSKKEGTEQIVSTYVDSETGKEKMPQPPISLRLVNRQVELLDDYRADVLEESMQAHDHEHVLVMAINRAIDDGIHAREEIIKKVGHRTNVIRLLDEHSLYEDREFRPDTYWYFTAGINGKGKRYYRVSHL